MSALDAIDESRSAVSSGMTSRRERFYYIGQTSMLVFREDIVKGHHAFRAKTAEHAIIVDDVFKKTVKEAGLKGVSYQDFLKPL
ncbi:hypothetical protein GCM10022398_29080 [Acetobacter lovaniensis]|jgi:hypothetical protein|uniref:Immunity MXAN-0049 protein domain-containing protein n=2 Tax=Acetobacter lovaniensis TaxID=104100 RepID=A0A841QKU7_9PROT|nr:DUF1629 domain-containing protein [Acetobacter lovaniensis]MBB6458834.1 hypothetical protein [Acetobacter lovaniensis]MCP1240964.1 hypothetical protein [Acetobacter lovaniensis]NHN83007.1 hypothetical protein [Acetobacter lovaniensis]